MRSTSLGILIGAALVLVIAAAYVTRIRTGMSDFEVYYRTGQRFVAGESLYQTADGHYMFKYLPSSGAVYVPFALLPMEAAKAAWFTIIVGAFALVVVLSASLVAVPSGNVVLVAVVILTKYLLHELRLGQINTVILLLNILAIRALARTPPAQATSGAAAGLATAIKPYAALTIAYLLVKRQWRAFGVAVATVVLAQAVPMLTYGVSGTANELQLWRTTLSASTPVLLTNSDAISVLAFCTKWIGDPSLASLVALAVLGVLALVFLAVILRGANTPEAAVLEGAMLLTLTPLVSPLGWDYNFLMALPAVMLVVGHRAAFPKAAQVVLMANFALIALVLYDTLGRQAYAAFMQWSITTINFIIVVLALAYLRFTKVR